MCHRRARAIIRKPVRPRASRSDHGTFDRVGVTEQAFSARRQQADISETEGAGRSNLKDDGASGMVWGLPRKGSSQSGEIAWRS